MGEDYYERSQARYYYDANGNPSKDNPVFVPLGPATSDDAKRLEENGYDKMEDREGNIYFTYIQPSEHVEGGGYKVIVDVFEKKK